MTGWVPDVLPGYWQHTIPLGPDPHGEGDIAATLVRRGEPTKTDHAVLAVHGYTDYFFNAALADHFAERGFAFYALDMHKCGRSWRAGQTPHFATDLADYDRELDSALAVIRAQSGPPTVLVYGHSTGGLIVSLWLDRLRRRGATAQAGIGGLVLNSPWLDLHGSPVLRWAVTSVLIAAVARLHGKGVARTPGAGGYGASLHRDYHGEFDYNLQWKPPGGFPITFGWLHAVRRGQARLHRGLDVGVPNLILRSDHSVAENADQTTLQCGDAVLDVAQIARWAGCIGNRTNIVPVKDAKHDVFLSMPGPRQVAYRELDAWLDAYLGAPVMSGDG
ncbi:alpha/beta hydrolase [Mycobacterium xenopi]|uniref:alpha/beta hydrolase n=1 Tax=Mycobacterium xenopi TaxID=1789 RepID=UPI000A1668AC|nr:alpha/beta hydrolase [Mycobacterium xenopi]MDA3639395.1 alpha/beta hydrolase [Mycobacterium xenopi]MDA3658326.1 alpha/beta hydrolase [Mycobacterium xenopi]MDA3662082.1 alpha/beta hydrolase [Mycobacterium xenopi]ORX20530.1 alpha/beta hydrolase [Mycobacterium xenopi]